MKAGTPIVIVDDGDPLAATMVTTAHEAAKAGFRTVRGIVRFLREHGHRHSNARLEAAARQAIAGSCPPGLQRVPEWARNAGADVVTAVQLMDRALEILVQHRDRLEPDKTGRWAELFENADAIDNVCGWAVP